MLLLTITVFASLILYSTNVSVVILFLSEYKPSCWWELVLHINKKKTTKQSIHNFPTLKLVSHILSRSQVDAPIMHSDSRSSNGKNILTTNTKLWRSSNLQISNVKHNARVSILHDQECRNGECWHTLNKYSRVNGKWHLGNYQVGTVVSERPIEETLRVKEIKVPVQGTKLEIPQKIHRNPPTVIIIKY